jgi:hypothetical protein
MKLTPHEQQAIARRACWYFDCNFGPDPTQNSTVVFTGDGVADLQELIDRLTPIFAPGAELWRQRIGRYLCNVGTQYSCWKPFDLEDVQAILGYYIAYYGNVNKPTVTTREDLADGPAAVQL